MGASKLGNQGWRPAQNEGSCLAVPRSPWLFYCGWGEQETQGSKCVLERCLDARNGGGGPKHRDAASVVIGGPCSHRPALPGCPVPKLLAEMVMLLQSELPGPPNPGYLPPAGAISGWCPFQPSLVQGEQWAMHVAASPPQRKPSSRVCTTPHPPPAGFGPIRAELLPNPGDHSRESKPKLALCSLPLPRGQFSEGQGED